MHRLRCTIIKGGNFSGIETKKISTKSTTTKQSCSACMGNGVLPQKLHAGKK